MLASILGAQRSFAFFANLGGTMETISRTRKDPEALVHGLNARLSVGTHVGQTWGDAYRKAVKATAKAHYVSEDDVEDAYIADGIARALAETEPTAERIEEIERDA